MIPNRDWNYLDLEIKLIVVKFRKVKFRFEFKYGNLKSTKPRISLLFLVMMKNTLNKLCLVSNMLVTLKSWIPSRLSILLNTPLSWAYNLAIFLSFKSTLINSSILWTINIIIVDKLLIFQFTSFVLLPFPLQPQCETLCTIVYPHVTS